MCVCQCGCVCLCASIGAYVHVCLCVSMCVCECAHTHLCGLCVCVCVCACFATNNQQYEYLISNILSFVSYVRHTLQYTHLLLFQVFIKDIYNLHKIQCIHSFIQGVMCQCLFVLVCAHVYTEKLLVNILEAKRFL